MSPLGPLADPAKVGRARRRERDNRTREQIDVEAVLSTEAGRRLYYRIVYLLCDIEGDTFDTSIRDGICAALHQARDNGRRAVGRKLRNEAQNFCPELWERVILERVAARKSEETRRELEHYADQQGEMTT